MIPLKGLSLVKKDAGHFFLQVTPHYRAGEIFLKEEDEVVLDRSLTFPEQPGEFLVGRNGIHVPLCNVQADDDAGDVANCIPDAVK
jgi:hypothetical protein